MVTTCACVNVVMLMVGRSATVLVLVASLAAASAFRAAVVQHVVVNGASDAETLG